MTSREIGPQTMQAGDILINGHKQTMAYRTSAYVTQDDLLTSTLNEEKLYTTQPFSNCQIPCQAEEADFAVVEVGIRVGELDTGDVELEATDVGVAELIERDDWPVIRSDLRVSDLSETKRSKNRDQKTEQETTRDSHGEMEIGPKVEHKGQQIGGDPILTTIMADDFSALWDKFSLNDNEAAASLVGSDGRGFCSSHVRAEESRQDEGKSPAKVAHTVDSMAPVQRQVIAEGRGETGVNIDAPFNRNDLGNSFQMALIDKNVELEKQVLAVSANLARQNINIENPDVEPQTTNKVIKRFARTKKVARSSSQVRIVPNSEAEVRVSGCKRTDGDRLSQAGSKRSKEGGGQGHSAFKFDNFWIRHGEFRKVVEEAWRSNGAISLTKVMNKIQSCSEKFKDGMWRCMALCRDELTR
ncbi:hypothetical protein COLO4_24431 [Corchorus olitorius]|uniref:Uncharacterized protein n=1 Tax=Corchorus olitorius TaxID=93759 RepID=A0A1R3IA65_9ROSI|nr:hypothetical protein COLO4_24431 [Corchorus olitorius]